MKQGKISAARIMKYVVLLIVVAFIVFLMLFASGSNKPFEEVSQAVGSSLDTTNLSEQDTSRLKRNFGLNAADYAGVMYYASDSNISAEEVLLIKVKSEEQVQRVTDAIGERIESRKNDFDGYLPEEVQLLDDARQSVRGTYIFYASSPKADTYLDTFSGSL
nr:DUF4358 domain-containing protein [uncultured Mediterraneibacter sp.]